MWEAYPKCRKEGKGREVLWLCHLVSRRRSRPQSSPCLRRVQPQIAHRLLILPLINRRTARGQMWRDGWWSRRRAHCCHSFVQQRAAAPRPRRQFDGWTLHCRPDNLHFLTVARSALAELLIHRLIVLLTNRLIALGKELAVHVTHELLTEPVPIAKMIQNFGKSAMTRYPVGG